MSVLLSRAQPFGPPASEESNIHVISTYSLVQIAYYEEYSLIDRLLFIGWVEQKEKGENWSVHAASDSIQMITKFRVYYHKVQMQLPAPTIGSLNSVMSFIVTRNSMTSPLSFFIGPTWNKIHVGVPKKKHLVKLTP